MKINEARELYPWDMRVNMAFFRGGAHGGNYDNYEYEILNLNTEPNLSKKYY